jgi:uncharacterized membrane protein YdjX (TVP38/TMEM64 family)
MPAAPAEGAPGARLRARPAASMVKPVALLLVVTGSLLAFYLSPLHELLMPEGLAELRNLLSGSGRWTPLVFVAACALGVGFGLPRLAFAGLGGLLFGALVGSIVAQLGTLAGCVLAFGWARWLGRDYVQRRESRRLRRLLDQLRRRPILANVLLRVCPVGNAFATNLLCGVSPMGLRDFAVGTFLGTLPETVVLALFGASVHHGSPPRLIAGAVLMAALLVGWSLTARRSAIAAEIEGDLDPDAPVPAATLPDARLADARLADAQVAEARVAEAREADAP